MSEMIGASVRVKIPRAWVEFTIRETYSRSGKTYEDPSLVEPDGWEEGDARWAVRNLVEEFCSDYLDVNDVEGEPEAVILSLEGELNYGWFSGDEYSRGGPLLKARIPFTGQSDAKYEYDGSVEHYDGNPEGAVRGGGAANNDGDPYLTLSDLKAIAVGCNQAGFTAKVKDWIRTNEFELEKCDISHLLQTRPEEGT